MNVPELKLRASGRYIEIVGYFIPELSESLQRPSRGIKCPCHGSKDGFNFGNRFNETGRGFCQLTGGKDIFQILEMWLGWTFKESLKKLTEYLGGESPTQSTGYLPGRKREKRITVNWNRMKKTLTRYYNQTIPDNGLIKKYLHSRGIDIPVPPTLRLHPHLKYFDGDFVEQGRYPAMICKIIAGFTIVGLHTTYLKKDGSGKAEVPNPRKIRSCSPLFNEGNIPLYEFDSWPGDILMVGEGVETCLAAHELTGKPVWCAMSARGLENIKVPESILKVQILVDNDLSGAGLLAAEKLKTRLEEEGRVVELAIPAKTGDWNDYLLDWKKNK